MFLSPPALFPHLLPQWDSFYPNPDQSDLLGNQIPEREKKQMYFAWKKENSRVQGELELSSNLKGQ